MCRRRLAINEVKVGVFYIEVTIRLFEVDALRCGPLSFHFFPPATNDHFLKCRPIRGSSGELRIVGDRIVILPLEGSGGAGTGHVPVDIPVGTRDDRVVTCGPPTQDEAVD